MGKKKREEDRVREKQREKSEKMMNEGKGEKEPERGRKSAFQWLFPTSNFCSFFSLYPYSFFSLLLTFFFLFFSVLLKFTFEQMIKNQFRKKGEGNKRNQKLNLKWMKYAFLLLLLFPFFSLRFFILSSFSFPISIFPLSLFFIHPLLGSTLSSQLFFAMT